MISTAIHKRVQSEPTRTLTNSAKVFGACSCFFFGSILIIAAALMLVIGFFDSVRFNHAEAVMLFSAMLLWMAGAHLMDIIEARERKQRK